MHRVHWLDVDWKNSRGLGFQVSRREDKTYIGHGGACPGYRTQVTLSPKDKVAVIVLTNTDDANPEAYVWEIFDLVAPALSKAVESPGAAKKPAPDLERFVGHYERPIGLETQVFLWDGGLALLALPNDNPSDSMTKLRRIKGNTFRRLRDDGELGEEIVFETGPDGKIAGFVRNSQRLRKL
jgi:hypothetical protein